MTIFRIYADTGIAQKFGALPSATRRVLTARIQGAATELSNYIKYDELSGQLLKSRSGRLRNSIYARVYGTATDIYLSVGSRGDVPYSRIYEVGGELPEVTIYPTEQNVLSFVPGWDDRRRAFAWVRRPARTVEGLHYIELAIEAKKDLIMQAIAGAVMEAMSGV